MMSIGIQAGTINLVNLELFLQLQFGIALNSEYCQPIFNLAIRLVLNQYYLRWVTWSGLDQQNLIDFVCVNAARYVILFQLLMLGTVEHSKGIP